MAQQPTNSPPPMAYVNYVDELRKRATDAKERSQALSAHNSELQERLWQQQQQLKQQQSLIEQLQADLASRSSHPAIEEEEEDADVGPPAPSVAPEEKTKKLAAKPSHSHPYLCKGVTSASRSTRPVSPWRRPTQAKK